MGLEDRPTSRPPGAACRTSTEYLDNADNLACTFVNVTHWICTGDAETHGTARPAGRAPATQVQRVLRLVNDLATHERDLEWGDLNALLLVDDPAEVQTGIAELVAPGPGGDLAPLAERLPAARRPT